MLVVISPAKRLDWTARDVTMTEPEFSTDAVELAEVARKLTVSELKALMGISDKLAALNSGRFADFSAAPASDAVRPAALAFAGDTYAGLDAVTLDQDAMEYAQRNLRILSGLYGLLRPLDAIQAYRLEMGSRLATDQGKTLYAYWGARITEALNAQAANARAKTIVNCASVEYFDAIDKTALVPSVITPVFMECKGGEPKIVSFYAKKARGAMARYMVENRIHTVEGLKGFDAGGYAFTRQDDDKLVFMRDHPETT